MRWLPPWLQQLQTLPSSPSVRPLTRHSCTPGPFHLPTAQKPGPQQHQLLSKFTNDPQDNVLYIKYAVLPATF